MQFSNLSIGRKLALAFTAMAMLIACALAFALYSLKQTGNAADLLVTENIESVRLTQTVRTNGLENLQMVSEILITEDASIFTRKSEAIERNRKATNAAYDKLENLVSAGEERELFEQAKALRKKFVASRNDIIELSKKAHFEAGKAKYMSELQPAAAAYMETLDKFVALQNKEAEDVRLALQVTETRGLYGSVVAAIVALLLGSVLAWRVTSGVTGGLARAVAVAEAVAQGNLAVEAKAEGRDEVAQLLRAMDGMVQVLKRFEAAQVEMSKQHNDGMISYRMPHGEFSGAYGQMAQSVNELVFSHIAVKMRIVEVVQAYAKGDFSVDMDKLPGEKAKITNAIDGVKKAFADLSKEVVTLVEAAVRGDFTARGDAAKYDHDFKRMVDGLNRLMAVSDKGLAEVSRVLAALARGDLTERIDGDYQGTFGKLRDDCNATTKQLQEIVSQIQGAAGAIGTASSQIAAGNQDLSSRTEEQASSLQETASSMEELTSTVKHTADSAKEANGLAAEASAVAVKGGTVVGEVVSTMSSIEDASKKIADIIGVIDEIAFQTNILALNAAVEAARAGEQGRGFAVVASEVRNLAQRSAEAAKQIKGLIGDSVEKVGEGTRLVQAAGTTMEDIVASVRKVTEIMSEISAATTQQSSGIEQVNQAIAQMDQVTQQNAALVEESAAAAESMKQQAGGLSEAVSTFRMARG